MRHGIATTESPASMSSWKGSQALYAEGLRTLGGAAVNWPVCRRSRWSPGGPVGAAIGSVVYRTHRTGRFCQAPAGRAADAARSQPLSDKPSRSPPNPGGLLKSATAAHPSRPNAIACCFLSSVKTLLTRTEDSFLTSHFNVLADPYNWPVFRFLVAGQLWVTPEGRTQRHPC